jgi:hypothetical protein
MKRKRIPFTVSIEMCDLIGPRPRVKPVIDISIHFETKLRFPGPNRAMIIPGEDGTQYGFIFSNLPASLTHSEVHRICERVLIARYAVADTVRALYTQASSRR